MQGVVDRVRVWWVLIGSSIPSSLRCATAHRPPASTESSGHGVLRICVCVCDDVSSECRLAGRVQQMCGVEHAAIFSKFPLRQWLPMRGFVLDFLGLPPPRPSPLLIVEVKVEGVNNSFGVGTTKIACREKTRGGEGQKKGGGAQNIPTRVE